MSTPKDRNANFVLGTGQGPKVNQHAPVFGDKRTKRNRDRSNQQRKAIQRSKDEQ